MNLHLTVSAAQAQRHHRKSFPGSIGTNCKFEVDPVVVRTFAFENYLNSWFLESVSHSLLQIVVKLRGFKEKLATGASTISCYFHGHRVLKLIFAAIFEINSTAVRAHCHDGNAKMYKVTLDTEKIYCHNIELQIMRVGLAGIICFSVRS